MEPTLAAGEIEIFDAGDYPQGRYTEADLDQIAGDYDPKKHEAPLVLDHEEPAAGAERKGPAYGWVAGLRRVGTKLVAQTAQVAGELKDLVAAGRYKKRSAEIYRDFQGTGRKYLKAVAFLGADIPAVKGLRDPVFREDAGPFDSFTLAAPKTPPRAGGDRPMAEITKDQMDAAIADAVKKASDATAAQFAERLTKLESEATASKTEATAAKAEAAAARAELAESAATARRKEFEAFAESMAKRHGFDAPTKARVVGLMEALQAQKVKDGEAEKPAADLFREVFEAIRPRPPLGEDPRFREVAGGATGPKVKGEDGKEHELVLVHGASIDRFNEVAAMSGDNFEEQLLAHSRAHRDQYVIRP